MAQYKDGDSRQINGVTYVRQNGQWMPQGGAMGPAIGGNPLIQGQLQAQGPSIAGQQLQNVHTQQQIDAQPLQNANTQTNIAQGQASIANQTFSQKGDLRDKYNALPEVKTYKEALQALGGAMQAPDSPQGDLAIVYSFAKTMDPGSVVREGEMDMANQTASIVQRIQQQYGMIGNGKRLPPDVRLGLVEAMRQRVYAMRPAYDQQRGLYADLAKKSGFEPVDVIGKSINEAYTPIERNYIKAHGGTPKVPTADYSGMVGDNAVNLATGAFRNVTDAESASIISRSIKAGIPYAQVRAMLPEGATFSDQKTYDDAVRFARQHRGAVNVEALKSVSTTQNERDASSPFGSLGSGMAKAATLGFADEGAGLISKLSGGDYARGRDAFAGSQSLLAAENPKSDLAGQAIGGAITGYGIANGLSKVPALSGGLFGARTPFPQLLQREAVAGDALYGAGYGAGSDNDNRLRGAGLGLGIGVGGGIGARAALGSAASAISPTGGAMRPLYDMGVRPSIGQRMGGVANTIEEKLQSIPLVGDAIKGTRDRARDQFQIGLFNDSLGEIGQQLPQGTEVGHAPHAFAQDAFNQAYDSARSGMSVAPDSHFISDVANLQKTVGALRPESQRIFDKLWSGSVERRAATGALNGNAYKSAVSELGKKASAIRSNPTGDAELADALDAASEALKQSAMRNSPPQAVAAMNAADKGYAKLVRLEEASRKPGGEPAEFSPTQYNNAVKTASGGVRNRAYLRGDALNADIAGLGTRLGDKVSNSGTVDRLLAGMAVGGAGYVEPISATVLGGLGAINAPGIRNATTGLMAPHPFLDPVADQLRRRARLAGMFGAPLALDNYAGQ